MVSINSSAVLVASAEALATLVAAAAAAAAGAAMTTAAAVAEGDLPGKVDSPGAAAAAIGATVNRYPN